MASFNMNDRVELTKDWGRDRPALRKGRKGTITGFPYSPAEAMRFCYVKFDGYTGGTVTVPYNKLKKA